MADLYGITISTNYADLLGLIIDQNQKFFTKWYIVTAIGDQQTIDVVNRSNYAHIELLFFNFKKGGATFNKGGALQMAQKLVIANHGENVNVLIVDSDIYLPDEFGPIYNEITILPNKLYSMLACLDFHTYNDFIEKKNAQIHHASNELIGCFQLYKQTADKLYYESINCAECDIVFRDLFLINGVPAMKSTNPLIINDIARIEYYITHNCIYLPINICHLGYCNTNWNGRNSTENFIANDSLQIQQKNNFIGKTLNIYIDAVKVLDRKFICSCILNDNNKAVIKLPNHIIDGHYEILSDFICQISFYSFKFLCIIVTNINITGKLSKKISVYDLKYSITYNGQLI